MCRTPKEELILLQESRNMQSMGRHDVVESGQGGGGNDWSEVTKSEEFNPWMMAKLVGS